MLLEHTLTVKVCLLSDSVDSLPRVSCSDLLDVNSRGHGTLYCDAMS